MSRVSTCAIRSRYSASAWASAAVPDPDTSSTSTPRSSPKAARISCTARCVDSSVRYVCLMSAMSISSSCAWRRRPKYSSRARSALCGDATLMGMNFSPRLRVRSRATYTNSFTCSSQSLRTLSIAAYVDVNAPYSWSTSDSFASTFSSTWCTSRPSASTSASARRTGYVLSRSFLFSVVNRLRCASANASSDMAASSSPSGRSFNRTL